MRASELLSAEVVAADGSALGPVRDLRLRVDRDGSLTIRGLVVGGGRFAAIAHAWGFAEGRAQGPWILRRLTDQARRAARFIPSEKVTSWGREVIEVEILSADAQPLSEALGQDDRE